MLWGVRASVRWWTLAENGSILVVLPGVLSVRGRSLVKEAWRLFCMFGHGKEAGIFGLFFLMETPDSSYALSRSIWELMYSLFQVFVPPVREKTLHKILSLFIAQTTWGHGGVSWYYVYNSETYWYISTSMNQIRANKYSARSVLGIESSLLIGTGWAFFKDYDIASNIDCYIGEGQI